MTSQTCLLLCLLCEHLLACLSCASTATCCRDLHVHIYTYRHADMWQHMHVLFACPPRHRALHRGTGMFVCTPGSHAPHREAAWACLFTCNLGRFHHVASCEHSFACLPYASAATWQHGDAHWHTCHTFQHYRVTTRAYLVTCLSQTRATIYCPGFSYLHE